MEDLDIKAKRLVDLQDMLISFSKIERLIYFPDTKNYKNRKENNSEHSYSLAMATWYLSQYFENINSNLAIKYALVHDLVELHAGDEQIIGRTDEAEERKRQREANALKRLENDLPDFSEVSQLIHEYHEKSTPESKFVYALDKVMPDLLNMLSNGKGWKAGGFTLQQMLEAKDKRIAVSPEVKEIWQSLRSHIIANQDRLFDNKTT